MWVPGGPSLMVLGHVLLLPLCHCGVTCDIRPCMPPVTRGKAFCDACLPSSTGGETISDVSLAPSAVPGAAGLPLGRKGRSSGARLSPGQQTDRPVLPLTSPLGLCPWKTSLDSWRQEPCQRDGCGWDDNTPPPCFSLPSSVAECRGAGEGAQGRGRGLLLVGGLPLPPWGRHPGR